MADPELVARLKTDATGEPVTVSGRRFTHYRVEFEVRNPPPDTYAATFELDPSYPDPVQTLPPDPEGKFRLATTTYGDYPIVVRLRTRKGDEFILKESVARALRRTSPATPSFTAAVDYIAAH